MPTSTTQQPVSLLFSPVCRALSDQLRELDENLEDFTVDLKEQLLTVTAKPGLDADGIMAEVDKTNKKINQLDENGKLIPRPGEDENGIPIAKPDDA